jgi:hypothetical protein
MFLRGKPAGDSDTPCDLVSQDVKLGENDEKEHPCGLVSQDVKLEENDVKEKKRTPATLCRRM